MKKNKLLKIIKDNWYWSFILIGFISFCIENRQADNDIWFLLNNGRYILNHGFFHTDPFTIHVGLHCITQQWLSSVVFYLIYNYTGKYGLLTLINILFILMVFIHYKLCYLISKNKKQSIILTEISTFLISGYMLTRPQIFTFTILILETYFFELYVQKKKWQYLIPLPILSVLLINFHAAMWFLQFVFLLPFIANTVKIKKITIYDIELKPLLIIALLMFLAGFINPYGIEAITYIFDSYGIKAINSVVTEMKSPFPENPYWYINVCFFILFIILIICRKKKIDIRFFCFALGLFIFGSMHNKTVVYFPLYLGYIFSPLELKLPKIKNKIILYISKIILYGTSLSLIILSILSIKTIYSNYSMNTNNINSLVDYLLDNYKKEDIVLFVGFNDGGYTEYYDLKGYIDGRAEIFAIKLNKKTNILKEYAELTEKKSPTFLKKYNYTHILIDQTTKGLFNYLEKGDDNYVLEQSSYFDTDKKMPLGRLYVRKDLSKIVKLKKIGAKIKSYNKKSKNKIDMN